MTELLQLCVGGLFTGVLYAGLALALSVVYAGTGILNFAQGQMAVVSAFVALDVVQAGQSFWGGLLAGVGVGVAGGALVERVFVRPVHDAPVLAQFTVTAALLLGLDGLVTLVWDSDQHAVTGPFGDSALTVGPVTTTAQQLGAGATVVVVMLAVAAFFRFTSIGLKLRAVASNPQSAALLGIRRRRMLTLGWAVAGGIGAVTAVMAAPTLSVGADMMTAPLLLAFAAGSLGGFDSRIGAVVGGLLIGLLTALAGRYLPGVGGDLALAVPFAVIWLVLLVRPAGLFGTRAVVRA